MSSLTSIKTALERTSKALTLKPALGRDTGISKTRVREGLTCDVQEGNWKLSVDMPAAVGGNGSAPSPGVYGRAAFGSCLAIGYMMQAAKLGVAIHALEVEVQADFDDGVLLGVHQDVPAGYTEVRYTVTVESDAPEQDIMRVLDEGDAHSPYLDVFGRAQACVRNVKIVSPQQL
jgi:uncharacterized OsmC-like protein